MTENEIATLDNINLENLDEAALMALTGQVMQVLQGQEVVYLACQLITIQRMMRAQFFHVDTGGLW